MELQLLYLEEQQQQQQQQQEEEEKQGSNIDNNSVWFVSDDDNDGGNSKKNNIQNNNNNNGKINMTTFVKTISKLLRHACYGSPASHWVPIVLPLLATLLPPTQQQQQIQFKEKLYSDSSSDDNWDKRTIIEKMQLKIVTGLVRFLNLFFL